MFTEPQRHRRSRRIERQSNGSKWGEIVLHFRRSTKILDWRGGLHNTAAMLNCGSPGWRALGQATLVYLAIASSAARAQDSQPGRRTLAEMVAFARLGSAACQRLAPDVEGFHALALLRLIKPPLTDKEIVAKEKELKRLRDRLGLSRWCRRYAGEMEQARILVEVLRRQN